MAYSKKKRRLLFRRKRTLDPGITIDYKQPDTLKRFVTDRGKIIPRRISGATAAQQRKICRAVKRARYLALLPYSLAHRTEANFAAEMSAIASSSMGSGRAGSGFRSRRPGGPGGPRGDRDGPRGDRDGPAREGSAAPRDEAPRPKPEEKKED